MAVSANTVIFEDDFNETEFSQNDFWSGFNIYNANENNFVMQGDNGYYHGKWTEGASAVFLEELEDYTLIAKLKTSGNSNQIKNCYKSAVLLRVPVYEGFIFEPDNGDEDGSSYLGSSGIFLYCYGNTLEVGVHTMKAGGTAGPVNPPEGNGTKLVVENPSARHYGIYTVAYLFNLPEGKTFDQFTDIKVVDKKDKISVYVADTLICELQLSDIGEVTTKVSDSYWNKDKVGDEVFSGQSYRTVAIKDASGNEVLKVEDAVVATVGSIGFANRANSFMVDYLKIELNYDITPEPTKEATPAPTPGKTEAQPTQTPEADNKAKDSDSNVLTYVLIGVSVLVAGGAIFIIVKTSDKNKNKR